MTNKSPFHLIWLLAASTALLAQATAPSAESDASKKIFFGETHVHTAYSLDAYLGGTRLTPSDAYRHARGEAVVVNGKPSRLRRPLDFAAVTDHAEYLGEMFAAHHPDAPGADAPEIRQLVSMTDPNERREWFLKYVVGNSRGGNPTHLPFYPGDVVAASGWRLLVEAAEEHNAPGEFTTFPAYEWSSAPEGANLHRNIIFRGSQVPEAVMSAFELPREEALWRWLATNEEAGIRALAIPHNSNASKGLMFPDTQSDGSPLDKDYAKLRSRFERTIEIMQIKGNSEVSPQFWAADEFADFESAPSLHEYSGRVAAKQNYVRHGLARGLQLETSLGGNPFKLGISGGTDSHNGLMGATEEYDWPGGHGFEDGTARRRQTAEVGGWIAAREQSPGSLSAVWATENTREAIWDSLYARESYATSGTRIAVRFFGGWEFEGDPAKSPDMVEIGYRDGVPMGRDLPPRENPDAPRFLIAASKDALGANLDRIQVIKAWVSPSGELKDKVFDVVWSGDRRPDSDGKLPPVGNTVDIRTATYSNTVGAAQLTTVWQDPAFDPALPALYYVRVLEIPTPRWTTYDSANNGLPLLDSVAATVQERAWSSPIWYRP
jgi:hypothetical protein